MGIEIKEFRPYSKNTLKGFLTIELQPTGLEIRDITYHESNGKRWLNMPSKSYEKDGNTKYSYWGIHLTGVTPRCSIPPYGGLS